jgi:hypothetical protein
MATPPPSTADWKSGFGRRLAIYLIGVVMGLSMLMVIQGIKARQRAAQHATQPQIDGKLAPVPAPTQNPAPVSVAEPSPIPVPASTPTLQR